MVFSHITDFMTFYGILSHHWLTTCYGIPSNHWTRDFLWYSLTSLTHNFLWYSLKSLNSWLFVQQNFSSTKHVNPTSTKTTSTCFLCGQQLSHWHVQLHTWQLLTGSAVHCGRLHYILVPNITLEQATQVFFKNFLTCHTLHFLYARWNLMSQLE